MADANVEDIVGRISTAGISLECDVPSSSLTQHAKELEQIATRLEAILEDVS